jgi:quinol monooxygenase YgiN
VVEHVVRLTVDMTVHEGQMAAFEGVARKMTEGSAGEAGTLGYEWFAGGDGRKYRLVETYENAAAVEAHFMGPVVQQLVPQLAALCAVDGLEFYGDPGPKVREMAGALGGVVFHYWIGINR